MTRSPVEIPAMVGIALALGTVIAGCAILLTRPALGDDCRFRPCPVAYPSASVPAGTYRVRRHYRVVYRPARSVMRPARRVSDTLTAADRRAAPEMPLVWPVLETIEALPPHPVVPVTSWPLAEPRQVPWAHTDPGKWSILAFFVALAASPILGSFAADYHKRKSHERQNQAALHARGHGARHSRRSWWRAASGARGLGALERIAAGRRERRAYVTA